MMKLACIAMLGSSLTTEAFMPRALPLASTQSRVALSSPGPRHTTKSSGAIHARAHLDPGSVWHVVDTLQARSMDISF